MTARRTFGMPEQWREAEEWPKTKMSETPSDYELEKRHESRHAWAILEYMVLRPEGQSEGIMKRPKRDRRAGRGCHAFTRVEVLALVAVLALLALVVVPTRANTRSRSA